MGGMDRRAWSSWHDLKEAWFGGVRFEGKLRRESAILGMVDCWWSMGFAVKVLAFIDDFTIKAGTSGKRRKWGRWATRRAFPSMALAAGRQGQGAELAATFRLRLRFSTILTQPVSQSAPLRCGNPILQP